MVRKTAESYEDTLTRLDIPPEGTVEEETFRAYLIDELGITNVEFQDSLWQAQITHTAPLAEHEIRAVTRRFAETGYAIDVRYAIQGMPGLWGYDTVRAIREAEGW